MARGAVMVDGLEAAGAAAAQRYKGVNGIESESSVLHAKEATRTCLCEL